MRHDGAGSEDGADEDNGADGWVGEDCADGADGVLRLPSSCAETSLFAAIMKVLAIVDGSAACVLTIFD